LLLKLKIGKYLYVARVANSNIATNARKTYVEELRKLDLEIDKILLGSNLRIKDDTKKHYFSDGSKVAKAYANLSPDHQSYFENILEEILSNPSVDAFNKLHFYNTYNNYRYFLKDSLKQQQVKDNINQLIPLLPEVIKSRIENPNKQLYDLLYQEKEELDQFQIESSVISRIWSYSYGGECWMARLLDKGINETIGYSLTMPIGEEITPLKNFLDKKNELKSRVENHSFLQKIVNDKSESKLYISFTKDKSFANHRNKVIARLPKTLAAKLDFNNAISLYLSYPRLKQVRFILFANGELLVLRIPEGFEMLGFQFEDLNTDTEESIFKSSYESYKLFSVNGEMLN